MAKHEDRDFVESDGLNLGDEGIEERAPAWAQEMEKAKQSGKTADNADASREEKEVSAPLRQGRALREKADTPADAEGEDAPDADQPESAPTDRQAAQDAWDREARRVESAAGRRTESRRSAEEAEKSRSKRKNGRKNRKSSRRGKKKKGGGDDRENFLRNLLIIVISSVLFVMVAMMVVSNFVKGVAILDVPRQIVTSAITPVQRLFSGVTDRVVEYLRTLKIRGNLEYEYDQLLIRLDELATEVAVNEELRRTNQALYDLLDEQQRNREMNPVAATVIGTDSNNYFSTLTLDVGSANGVTDYMAVVAQGGLVGVTYDVTAYKCQVRCIINSDCTVAGLVQSSRDQGSVKGTLGTNGEAMCRMYYLPDSSLPRPGDVVVTSGVGLEFPKGIPIGYIRESTRGMEDNKSYVVLEPVVDFQHLEYVTVYRYRPTYAEAAQKRVSTSSNIQLEPLITARPIPEWEIGGVSDFIFTATSAPGNGATQTPEAKPTATPAPTARPTATPNPNATQPPPNLEYKPADLNSATATPSPRPTFTPTPSPVPTPDPGAMTVEDDE